MALNTKGNGFSTHKKVGLKQRKVMSIPFTRGSIISTGNRDLESWFGRKTVANTRGSGLKMCLRVLVSINGFQMDKCTMASITTTKCTDLGSRHGPTTGSTKGFTKMT
jgi:hypothetical protein